ncbi:MAG TPA: LemA family protein [Thermoanaerobaculia bacterium]|nr:LemA family protein [Thermoanaerobaculia bacterium]
MPVALLLDARPATVATVLAWATAIAVLLWVVLAYNRLVRARLLAREAWSGVDVQLRRRHDLVPRLVEAVAGYARFERTVLSEVTELRSGLADSSRPDRRLQERENALADRLGGIFALVEGYPDLKADRGFLELQRELVEVEEQLQLARRYYNGAVRDYAILRESFPSNLVARVFSFEPSEFFEVQSASERLAPQVALAQSPR